MRRLLALALLPLSCAGEPPDSSVDGSTASVDANGASGDAAAEGDAGTGVDAGSGADASGTTGDPGSSIGSMWNTYYYLALEADYSGGDDTTLYDADCNAIDTVPAEFSDDLCIEGSGKLEDGRVINYASTCSCGRSCASYSYTVCYSVLDATAFPWGMGSRSNPLVPLRSWAVDATFISIGTPVYAQQWDGVAIPPLDGIGGFTHDGCFRADDVGGAIDDNHYDFFAGSHDMWQALEDIYPTESTFDVFEGGERCSYLAE